VLAQVFVAGVGDDEALQGAVDVDEFVDGDAAFVTAVVAVAAAAPAGQHDLTTALPFEALHQLGRRDVGAAAFGADAAHQALGHHADQG
jgi:hypothetical protein